MIINNNYYTSKPKSKEMKTVLKKTKDSAKSSPKKTKTNKSVISQTDKTTKDPSKTSKTRKTTKTTKAPSKKELNDDVIIPKATTKTSPKIKRGKSYKFSLNGINTIDINRKFGIQSKDNTLCEDNPDHTTKISDLNKNKKTSCELFSFLDETKAVHLCLKSNICLDKKNLHCFWCKHTFLSPALGCPINYQYPQAVKRYISEISKEKYTIKESISKDRIKTVKEKDINNEITIAGSGYYETDGIFCSFNCCEAFIQDNKRDPIYYSSSRLLRQMYMDILKGTRNDNSKDGNDQVKIKSISIMPAPHWRLLRSYGGCLTIEKYREAFNKSEYIYHGFYKSESSKNKNFAEITRLYEENIKF